MRTSGSAFIALGSAAFYIAIAPAFAEAPTPDTEEQRPAIVVIGTRDTTSTASKTGTQSRDIPASIQTVTSEVVQQQGALVLNEVVRNVSGIQPVYGGGYGYADNYIIRGLRMKFLRDGVADGPTFVGYARSFSDVERVEVLKGPGSAIYGRSEPGGTINMITKQPQFTPLASIAATLGSRNTVNVQGDVGVPLSRNFALRATGEYSTTDGIRGLGRELATGAVALVRNIADNQRFTAKGEVYEQRFVVDNFGIPAGFDGNPVAVPFTTRYYTPDNIVAQNIQRLTLGYSAEPTDRLKLRATYRIDRRDLDFRRNAGLNLNAAGQISSTTQRYHDDDSLFQIAQGEAVLDSTVGSIKGKTLFGYEYQRDRFSTVRREFTFANVQSLLAPTPRTNAAGLAPRLIFDRDLAADTHSLYLQHEAAIGSMIKIRGGYRFDFARYSDEGVSTATPVAGQAGPINRRFRETLGSGQIGAVFQPTSTLSLYGGYAVGEFVNIQTESASLTGEPESSTQIEAGVKWDVVPDRVNVNVAVFQIQRRHYNITLTPGAAPVPLGAQDSKGFEIDIDGEVGPGVRVLANYAYLDATNVSREVATTFGGTPFARTASIFGLEPAAAARHSGSIWATWSVPVGGGGLTVGAGFTAKSATFADTVNAIRIPGYAIGNAMLGWRSRNYEVALNMKNVTDERYFENATFAGGLPGDPRTVLVTVKARM